MKRNIISDKVKRALLQIGLTEKEVLTYTALLEQGAMSVQQISRITDTNRVTLYSAIEILKKKGLVAESKKGRRTLYVAEDPDTLSELLQEKKRKLKKEEQSLQQIILPTLNAISSTPQNRPHVSFYEGLDGVNKIFDKYILNCRSKYLIGCGSYDTALRAVSRKEEKKFLRQVKKRKILYKVILEDTPVNREFAAIGKGMFHVKFLPFGTKVSADIHAFDDYVSMTSYETLLTTLVQETCIAQNIRVY